VIRVDGMGVARERRAIRRGAPVIIAIRGFQSLGRALGEEVWSNLSYQRFEARGKALSLTTVRVKSSRRGSKRARSAEW
jgi:hypothetical protein